MVREYCESLKSKMQLDSFLASLLKIPKGKFAEGFYEQNGIKISGEW